MYWARSMPGEAWNKAVWCSTVRVEISNDMEVYPHLVRWLADHSQHWHIRDLKLSVLNYGDEDDAFPRSIKTSASKTNSVEWLFSPGRGNHCIWYKGWPFFVEREIPNEHATTSSKVREVIRVRCLGFKRDRIMNLLKNIQDDIEDNKCIKISSFSENYWQTVDNRRPRSVGTIVCKPGLMDGLANDMERFLGAFDWYADRGVPYRRGYLFSGPPGTGKSSTAIALAGHFRLPVYVLNLGSILTDTSLISAISEIPNRAILLIEDIDSAGVGSIRDREEDDDRKDGKFGITLSALLNCLDGALSREGRILIMTTNYPDRIDAALIRPGRVDVRVEFDLAGPSEIAMLFVRFFPEEIDLANVIRGSSSVYRSAAEIQAICLANHSDPNKAANELMLCGEKCQGQ